jgi:hypothetical protein
MYISNNLGIINVCNSILIPYSTYSRISVTKLKERTRELIGSFWAKCDSDKFQPAYEHVFREGKTLLTISICLGHFFHIIPFLRIKRLSLTFNWKVWIIKCQLVYFFLS